MDNHIELKTILLPPMLIQPLIENAILHGLIVDPKPNAHLEVKLKKNHNSIYISVEDNGVGINNNIRTKTKNDVKEKSIGLASIKERIEMINLQEKMNTASFSITPGKNNVGTIAIICLPLYMITK